jgi:hypothetical protein
MIREAASSAPFAVDFSLGDQASEAWDISSGMFLGTSIGLNRR